MKQFTVATLLIIIGCSPKNNEAQAESKLDEDTVVTIPSNPPSGAVTPGIVAIDFPLDSLLKFDSEAELISVFGDEIKRSIGYYPEGMGEYPNTLLFPGTENQVEFVWTDDSVTFSELAYIKIRGERTGWKTTEGITLGTSLKVLEKMNRKTFTFYGFGWDYSGTVNWKEGYLDERKVFVRLDYAGESIPPKHAGLLGDHEMTSDSELAQEANPVVCEITMNR